MEINYQDIGRRIRAIRKQKGFSQEQLAEIVNVGTSHISHIENGHTKMSVQVLIKISNALGISADELLCDHVYRAKEVLFDEMAQILADCNSVELHILTDIVRSAKASMRKRGQ